MPSKKLQITKSNGHVVPFDKTKLSNTLQRTGADKKTINEIIDVIRPKIKNRMRTAEIHKLIQKELEKRKPWAAARFDLRNAISKLGPAGYNFEKYVAAVLNAYGYKAENPFEYQGACITHEVDVTAEKNGRTAFIEAKFRHDFRATISIKDTLATWARFLDLVDGSKVNLCPHFDEAWIVTNARFTDQSLQYGHCKNMMLIGWNHPKERTFANMVDLDALYPVTIIQGLSSKEIDLFSKADLMLCRDLDDFDAEQLRNKTGIPVKRIDAILKECESIVLGDKA